MESLTTHVPAGIPRGTRPRVYYHAGQPPRPHPTLADYIVLTRFPRTTHHSSLTAHRSPLTTHYSPLTVHHSPLNIHYSPLNDTHHTEHTHAATLAHAVSRGFTGMHHLPSALTPATPLPPSRLPIPSARPAGCPSPLPALTPATPLPSSQLPLSTARQAAALKLLAPVAARLLQERGEDPPPPAAVSAPTSLPATGKRRRKEAAGAAAGAAGGGGGNSGRGSGSGGDAQLWANAGAFAALEPFPAMEAMALLPHFAAAHHSCEPNCAVEWREAPQLEVPRTTTVTVAAGDAGGSSGAVDGTPSGPSAANVGDEAHEDDDDGVFFCASCETHFSSAATLAKHTAAFHPTLVAAAPPPSPSRPPAITSPLHKLATSSA